MGIEMPYPIKILRPPNGAGYTYKEVLEILEEAGKRKGNTTIELDPAEASFLHTCLTGAADGDFVETVYDNEGGVLTWIRS